ncbi:protein cycle isoform X2 [Pieris rapae]|uniref:protein cycle isoform X2 n=1 Tax=Pieris rapae TaxID=64459 RepID=UPI001E27BFFF|nr:protein cycle isoform X2 [Pieris rapae]
MTREFGRMQDFYLHLHDVPQPLHYPFDMHGSVAGASAGYEVTTGAVAGAASEVGSIAARDTGLVPQAPLTMPHEQRKRKVSQFTESYEMSGCDVPRPASSTTSSHLHQPASATRKRKPSSYSANSGPLTYEDDGTEDSRSVRSQPDKRQNHSEIEKRRRDKMNTYISELSAMVPMCGAMARKLDKLTVLRMAVQHLRSVRGAMSAGPLTVRPRPAFLSERELNALVLRAAEDCFLMVVGCDRGRLLYLSASVTTLLHYDQSELLGQSLFDILHPKDVSKVKEQLSSSDLSPRERLIDAKTMLPVKADLAHGASRLCPGARRSFTCRIKCRIPHDRKIHDDERKPRKKTGDKKYCVVQCTGYLKSWAPAEMCEPGGATECAGEDEACNLSCLVAVGRAVPDLLYPPQPPLVPCTSSDRAPNPPLRQLQFISRHAPDGKFLFVDQRVTLALGFLPQELLGSSVYEYVSPGELGIVARAHKAALLRRSSARSAVYCFRRKDGLYASLITHFKPFRNPWTKDVESLVANNTVLAIDIQPSGDGGFDGLVYKNSAQQGMPPRLGEEADVEMQRLIDSQLECHKVGSTIAEEALRRPSNDFSPELPADLLQDALFNQQPSLVDNILCGDASDASESVCGAVRNNVPLSAAGARATPPAELCPTPPPLSPPPIDGNGEAAMAVIMSLLEADAGLGGPVNFSGLPWPLP